MSISKPRSFTDPDVSEAMVDESLRDRFAFVFRRGWMSWDGRRWVETDVAAIVEAARKWVQCNYLAAVAAHLAALKAAGGNKDDPAVVAAWRLVGNWARYTTRAKQDDLVREAKGQVFRRSEEFDADPDVLNVGNGILDLRTGELSDHDPARLLTKLAPADYVPGARHDAWDAALLAVPGDVVGWWQTRVGQGATGHIPEDDYCLFHVGDRGQNGKSTLMVGVQAVLGDYFILVPSEALTPSRAHPTLMAQFLGVRVGWVEELPDAHFLNAVTLKRLVGTSSIRARFIGQDYITFPATHTMFVNSNYTPSVAETDGGTWRRLVLVKFPYHFVKWPGEIQNAEFDKLGDPALRPRLEMCVYREPDLAQAVLAWLVEGAMGWYASLGGPPEPLPVTVAEDTLQWRESTDLIKQYVDEYLEFDPQRHVWSIDLKDDFNGWLQSRSQHPWTIETFAQRFLSHEDVRDKVVKVRTRTREKLSLSHSGAYGPSPGQYTAYEGVAFRRPSDDDDSGGTPLDAVQGVQTQDRGVKEDE